MLFPELQNETPEATAEDERKDEHGKNAPERFQRVDAEHRQPVVDADDKRRSEVAVTALEDAQFPENVVSSETNNDILNVDAAKERARREDNAEDARKELAREALDKVLVPAISSEQC